MEKKKLSSMFKITHSTSESNPCPPRRAALEPVSCQRPEWEARQKTPL